MTNTPRATPISTPRPLANSETQSIPIVETRPTGDAIRSSLGLPPKLPPGLPPVSKAEVDEWVKLAHDPVDHPSHYTGHPSGVECIQITEHMNFNVGNAVKYLWRAGAKGDATEDLRKAAWYIERELKRLDQLP